MNYEIKIHIYNLYKVEIYFLFCTRGQIPLRILRTPQRLPTYGLKRFRASDFLLAKKEIAGKLGCREVATKVDLTAVYGYSRHLPALDGIWHSSTSEPPLSNLRYGRQKRHGSS